MAKVRNPLEPMSTAVRAVVTLVAVLLGAGLLGLLFSDGVQVLGIGDTSVCAEDSTMSVGVGEGPDWGVEPAPGATVDLDAHPNYCTTAPSTAQSLLNTATKLVPFVFSTGALLLVLQLIRSAEREGLYTVRTAERLRKLGWWLLAGSTLAAIAGSTAKTGLIASLSRDSEVSALSGLLSWDIPYMAIFTGLGVLSFARVMRVGITMREDLEGTV
ncbi:DUF2975 domain-containing protein [Streptomyces alboniger]|uniref:DUF2975 domain-containing protein n=1 Tax=Streptomyces alboniger TaxID=132473 RepID=A0A5J6HC60_STRAD|nr:DUF2975 domain-containing protein [Streptomyces alboniger]QEV16150.1 DUF2975 domain-containing protein [Streptomyces alboniger]